MFQMATKMKYFSCVVFLAVIIQLGGADDSCPNDGCPSNDLDNLSQDDLVQVIKDKMVIPPPAVKLRPDLNMSEHEKAFKFRAQYGQPIAIQDLFHGKCIELGKGLVLLCLLNFN